MKLLTGSFFLGLFGVVGVMHKMRTNGEAIDIVCFAMVACLGIALFVWSRRHMQLQQQNAEREKMFRGMHR